MTVTDATADDQDLQWGYVLHPQGIEVISLLHEDIGPVIGWDTDPRTAFTDHPGAWSCAPAPAIRRTPPRVASAHPAPPPPPQASAKHR